MVAALRAAGCVFAEDEAALLVAASRSAAELDELVARRVGGEPIEHLVGWVDFDGRRHVVTTGVFVPRQRTVALVRAAAAVARTGHRVLDLCCGCGAIGAALAARVSGLRLMAVDVDPVAVDCARTNLAPYGAEVRVGDLYAPVPLSWRGRVDLLVANAPYVPTGAFAFLPSEARDHEPRVALDGGADGLDLQRRIIAEAPWWVAPGGHLIIESGRDQAPRTADLLREAGFSATVRREPEIDATVVVGRRPERTSRAP